MANIKAELANFIELVRDNGGLYRQACSIAGADSEHCTADSLALTLKSLKKHNTTKSQKGGVAESIQDIVGGVLVDFRERGINPTSPIGEDLLHHHLARISSLSTEIASVKEGGAAKLHLARARREQPGRAVREPEQQETEKQLTVATIFVVLVIAYNLVVGYVSGVQQEQLEQELVQETLGDADAARFEGRAGVRAAEEGQLTLYRSPPTQLPETGWSFVNVLQMLVGGLALVGGGMYIADSRRRQVHDRSLERERAHQRRGWETTLGIDLDRSPYDQWGDAGE